MPEFLPSFKKIQKNSSFKQDKRPKQNNGETNPEKAETQMKKTLEIAINPCLSNQ